MINGPSQRKLDKLLKYYHKGSLDDAEQLSINITKEFPNHQYAWKVLVSIYYETERLSEALIASKKTVTLDPKDYQSYFYLGNIFKKLGRNDEAKESYKKAVTINQYFEEGFINLGFISETTNNVGDAKKYYIKAINLNPNNANTHYNLGNVYRKLNNFLDAKKSYKRAVDLKSNHFKAHYSLGIILIALDNKGEAIEAFKESIKIRPDFANSYLNIGVIYQELGKLDEADKSLRKAISLNENLSDAYVNLGWVLKEKGDLYNALVYIKKGINLNQDMEMFFLKEGIIYHDLGDKKQALNSLEKASSIDPSSKIIEVVRNIFQKESDSIETKDSIRNSNITNFDNKFVTNKPVQESLIKYLYQIKYRELKIDKPINDARYGNGICSNNFELLDDSDHIIKSLKKDLVNVMETTLNSEISIFASFFNIFRGVSGTKIHNHINSFDQDKSLYLLEKKYSLVYYLEVGDQNCSEPGILKLYDPSENFLPSNGDIVIIPAKRNHSSLYNGDNDRVMVGVNFYTL
jgi:tetratricopeptide (TPR) repeat protein